MTEISPLGLVNVERSDLDIEKKRETRTAQGLPIPGCRLRIVDADGTRCASDGRTSGELQISSPWAAAAYFHSSTEGRAGQSDVSFVSDEGRVWLRTGDIATIDPHGYVRIVDRAKDLIKSGGEWISSQALELQLMNRPGVREAAVVARPDPKWQERPVICVALHEDSADLRDNFQRDYGPALSEHFPKWQIPQEVIFLDELPKGKTGKIDKTALRASLAGG